MSQISKATQSSESDTDFIQDNIQLTVFMEILLVVKMTRQLKQREARIKFI